MTTLLRRFAAPLLAALLLSGCALIGHHSKAVNSGTATAVTAAYRDINLSVQALQADEASFKASLDALTAHWSTSQQFIADRLAEIAYLNLNNPLGQNGVTAQMGSQLSAAAIAVGLPPSADVKDREIEDLRLALSAADGDKATLTARNEGLTTQATLLAGQTQLLTTQLTDKEVTLLAATKDVGSKTDGLATAALQVKAAADQTAQANLDKAREAAAKERLATARWFMLAGGILMALGIVGLFIHIPDAWVASASGASLLAVGWAITYVEDLLQQGWFRYTLDGLILSGIAAGVWFVIRAIRHHEATVTTSTVASNLVGAIQDASKANPALGAALQPFLADWHVTGTGATDQAAVAAINAIAVKLNGINPGQVAAATGEAKPVAAPVQVAPPTVIAPIGIPGTTVTVASVSTTPTKG